ncbi:hypothetical protein CT146_22825 [Escherichia coli]|nr:hypothetical protein CT146_22825 [Escherichia coli]
MRHNHLKSSQRGTSAHKTTHQSSCQPPACINATLAQHLTDCPATGCATTESMESPHPTS